MTVLGKRLADIHPNHRRIAAGASLIAVLTIVAKLFAAAREMSIAWRFGVSGTIDSYQLALTITTWLPMLLSSVGTVVLVPRLVALRGEEDRYRRFIAELNGTVILIGAAIAALVFILAPQAALLLGSGSAASTLSLTSLMSRLMAPVGLFTILCSYLSARLQSREHFSFSITEAVPAAAIVVFVLLPSAMSATTRLAVGTLIGFFLQFVVLFLMVQSGQGGKGLTSFPIRFRHRSSEWRSLNRSILVMIAAQAMLAFTIPLDQAFAARLGPGAIATLGYANRLVFLATSFGAVVLARALLPVLSGAVARADFRLGAHQARQWAFFLLGLGAVGALCIGLMSDWAVALVFERGVFTPEDSAKVSAALRMGALQLPFYFGGLAFVQWLAALGRYSALLVIASAGLGIKILLNILLVPGFGLEGIMLASAAMYALSFFFQMRAARIP